MFDNQKFKKEMNWTFSIKNKLKAAIVLLGIGTIVFMSNYRLKVLSESINDAVYSIYADRLMVQHLLFSYRGLLDDFQNGADFSEVQKKVSHLDELYFKTQLTKEERKLMESISFGWKEHLNLKLKYSGTERQDYLGAIARLEEIQVEEAQKQMKFILKANNSQDMGFYFESALVIILFLIAFALVSAQTLPEQLAQDQNHLLN